MKINDILIEYELGNIGKSVSTPGNKSSSSSSDTYGSRVANAVKGTVDNANKRPQDGFADAYASRNNPNGTKLTKDKVTQPGKGNKGAGTKPKAKYKFDQAVQDRQKELIAAGAKIKADGFNGPDTKQAEKDFGAKADAAKVGDSNSTSAYAPTVSDRAKTDPNVSGDRKADTPAATTTTTPPPETTPWGGKKDAAKSTWDGSTSATPDVDRSPKSDELDAIKKNAGLNLDPDKKSAISANPAGVSQKPDSISNVNPSTGNTITTIGGDEVNPDTDLKIAPKPVKTGTGGDTNITTASDDELAWRAKQGPFPNMNGYPGPGKWDPKTGRTKTDPNKPGFLDKLFGKKEESSDLDILRKLSGL